MSNSLRPHGLQHTRLPCPSPTPGVHPNSCLLSWWCHPAISSSVVPFSSPLQSFPASGSFQMSQFFTSGGQSIGVSDSASISSSVQKVTKYVSQAYYEWSRGKKSMLKCLAQSKTSSVEFTHSSNGANLALPPPLHWYCECHQPPSRCLIQWNFTIFIFGSPR